MLTIFTPTYNRAYCLDVLFKSLLRQTRQEFEWIIVDDGSFDNTRDLVNSFIQQVKFDIRYFYKENGGKQAAINFGVEKARGEFFFIVDSDDYLTDNAVEQILLYIDQVKDNHNFAGVVGLRGNDTETIILGESDTVLIDKFQKKYGEYIDATPIEYRIKLRIPGDRAEIVKTDILKKYPFPIIKGENFISEDYLWYSLANDGYKFRWFNTIIYITKYLPDGLTSNMKEVVKKNWKSQVLCSNKMLLIKGLPYREYVLRCIRYYRYGIYGQKNIITLFRECNRKILSIPCIIVSLVKPVK